MADFLFRSWSRALAAYNIWSPYDYTGYAARVIRLWTQFEHALRNTAQN